MKSSFPIIAISLLRYYHYSSALILLIHSFLICHIYVSIIFIQLLKSCFVIIIIIIFFSSYALPMLFDTMMIGEKKFWQIYFTRVKNYPFFFLLVNFLLSFLLFQDYSVLCYFYRFSRYFDSNYCHHRKYIKIYPSVFSMKKIVISLLLNWLWRLYSFLDRNI